MKSCQRLSPGAVINTVRRWPEYTLLTKNVFFLSFKLYIIQSVGYCCMCGVAGAR